MIRHLLLASLLALLVAPTVRADDDDALKVGKTAPDLKPKKMHQGEVPSLNTPEGCVVVEFWASNSRPCMPAMSALAKLYAELGPRGLQVIAVSDSEEEKPVEAWLKKNRPYGISYPVASDKDGEVKRNWMDKVKQESIPFAFLIGRGGRVLWIGNPLDSNFEPNVRKAMSGRFDPAMREKMDPAIKAAQKCAAVRNFVEAYTHYEEALEIDPGVALDVTLERFKVTLLKESNPKAAFDWLVQTAKKRYASDVVAIGEMVTMVLKDPEVKPHSVETAERLTELLAGKTGPKVLAIQAMVAVAKGDTAKAIDLQTEAWMSAAPVYKPEFKRALDEYRGAAARAAASAETKRGG